MKIRHTFLMEEGYWMATGEFFDQFGEAIPVEGSARVTHGKEFWRSQGVMRLNGQEIENNYEIRPFEEGKDYTGWTATNPALGKLTGLFVIVDDSIISTISSEDGQISGIEYMVRVSDYHYRSRGFIFRNGEKVSSWAAELVRKGLH
ncbi:MAG TPA: hypothetical protein VII64_01870 [Thermodesulfobacteriota bacterium]